jgi:tetrahydromethanopterin S-methyltransferase subunit B
VIPVPASRAELTLSFDSLKTLPEGAKFEAKKDRATVAVYKSEGGIIASADCDSLTLLVDELTTEIYHLKTVLEEFESTEQDVTTIEVNRLTWWQRIQIALGRATLVALGFGIGWWLINIKSKL